MLVATSHFDATDKGYYYGMTITVGVSGQSSLPVSEARREPARATQQSGLETAQIEDRWVRTGLIVGLIFLQHHEARTTTVDIVSVSTWTTSTRPTRGNHRILPLNQQVPGSSPGRRTKAVRLYGLIRPNGRADWATA
jgi:hypothetical protein